MRKLNKVRVAEEIVAICKDIQAFKEDVNEKDVKELETEVKKLRELALSFQDNNRELIKEIGDAEKKLKEVKDNLKKKFDAWKVKGESGYLTLRREVLAKAKQCLDNGEKLSDFIDDIEDFIIKKRKSEADSFKMKYEMLVTTLHNNGEYGKYAGILDSSCSKIITELKTGMTILDDKTNEWDKKVEQLAKERELDYDALINYSFTRPPKNKKKAGIMEDTFNLIQKGMDKFTSFISKTFKDIFAKVKGEGKKIDKVESGVDKLLKKMKKSIT